MKKPLIVTGNAAVAAGMWYAAWYFTKKKNTTAAVVSSLMASFSTLCVLGRMSTPQEPPKEQLKGISPYLRGPAGLIGMSQYYTQQSGYMT